MNVNRMNGAEGPPIPVGGSHRMFYPIINMHKPFPAKVPVSSNCPSPGAMESCQVIRLKAPTNYSHYHTVIINIAVYLCKYLFYWLCNIQSASE